MSFELLTPKELREVAGVEWFGVDLGSARNKAEIIKALEEEGITYELYTAEKARRDAAKPVEEPEVTVVETVVVETPVVKEVGQQYLIKMTRRNSYYQTYGKVFTQEHPFAICDDRTTRNILEKEEGFRTATPAEAESFYG